MDQAGSKAFVSNMFKMGKGKFARRLFHFYSGPWLIGFSLLTICGVLLGIFVAPEWFVFSLMIIFLIVPMAFAFLYFYYGLSRECYLNTVEHTVEPCENGISVRMMFRGLKDFDEEENKCNGGDEDDAKREFDKSIEFTIPYGNIGGFKIDGDGVYFEIRFPRKGFVWLPVSAYEKEEQYISTVKYILSRI